MQPVLVRLTAEEAGWLSAVGEAGEDSSKTFLRILRDRAAEREPKYRVHYRFPVGPFDPSGAEHRSNAMPATRALDLARRMTASGMWAESRLVEDTTPPAPRPEGSTRAKAHHDPDVDVEEED